MLKRRRRNLVIIMVIGCRGIYIRVIIVIICHQEEQLAVIIHLSDLRVEKRPVICVSYELHSASEQMEGSKSKYVIQYVFNFPQMIFVEALCQLSMKPIVTRCNFSWKFDERAGIRLHFVSFEAAIA